MSAHDIVIVAATRTAVGKFGGSLSKMAATEMGSIVIREAMARAKLDPSQIGEVIMGQVLAAGAGQNPARQALIKSGIAKETPALTINAVCGSGLKAVMLAAQAVAWGDSEIVIAGGQENMSAAPHVLNGSRDITWALRRKTLPKRMALRAICKTRLLCRRNKKQWRRKMPASLKTRSWAFLCRRKKVIR
jgi:acetyl-CoA acetyltransferase